MNTSTESNAVCCDDECWPSLSNTSQSRKHKESSLSVKPGIRRTDDNSLVLNEMKQTEEFLASEFSKLTKEERAEALNDIHCVGNELEETQEMVERLLEEFDKLVQKARNPIYDLAVRQNKAYVEEPSFRLRFLRYNIHDVPRSVRQMMEFLKHKATYFGEDKLTRDITLDDLNDDDMELLFAGLYHIQEEKDQSGRVVLYLLNEMLGRCSIETFVSSFRSTSLIKNSDVLTNSVFVYSSIGPRCLLRI